MSNYDDSFAELGCQLSRQLSELQSERTMLRKLLGKKTSGDHSAIYQRFLYCSERIQLIEHHLMFLGYIP